MSEQKANQDYRYPMAETFLYGPVTVGSFTISDRLPIFWGPGQYTTSYPSYTPPDTQRWRLYEHLNIPVVARFIYGNDDDTPDDEYTNDEDTGGGGDPDPVTCPGWEYEIVSRTWVLTVKPEFFRIPGDPYSGVDPYYIEVDDPQIPLGGDILRIYSVFSNSRPMTSDASYKGDTGAIVKVRRVSDNSLLSQSSAKDCFMLLAQPHRTIRWYNICIGGSIPAGGRRTLVEEATYGMAVGRDSSIPPRCMISSLQYVGSGPGTMDPFYWIPSNIVETGPLDFSEVPVNARNWYGCEDPGGQRSPPPPPSPFPYPSPPP